MATAKELTELVEKQSKQIEDLTKEAKAQSKEIESLVAKVESQSKEIDSLKRRKNSGVSPDTVVEALDSLRPDHRGNGRFNMCVDKLQGKEREKSNDE